MKQILKYVSHNVLYALGKVLESHNLIFIPKGSSNSYSYYNKYYIRIILAIIKKE